MATRTGRYAILEQFVADGFDYMFGNPGTVEQGFLDALWDFPQLKYVLTLQETIAVMAADGYARAIGRPALVQIHSTPGLGNAIGALYQAKRGHSPLVVIGGDAGIKYQAMDAQMAGNLVAMAEPVTKWATMVMDPASLLRVLRRAIKTAATPPTGPVYVCVPQDILDLPAVEEVYPTSWPDTRSLPDEQALLAAAEMLAAASHPMLFVGDGVAYSRAQMELARVADCLGAEVWDADSGELNMSHAHPAYQGSTGHMFGYQSLPIMQRGDGVLVCGTYLLPEVFPELGNVFRAGARVAHIDLDAGQIAKNHPVEFGFVSDPKRTLAQLAGLLDGVMTVEQKEQARRRLEGLAADKQARLQRELAADAENRDQVPLKFSTFMAELRDRLPETVVIFDEALTSSPSVVRYLPPTEPAHYFLTRGGSLGVGIPGAIGLKLAHPEKTVIGFTGDGGAMYTIQALWTAARHHVDAKFVICNNRSYRLLQLNISAYWKERGIQQHQFPLSFDLSEPPLRFDLLSESMGVPAERIEKPEQIGPAIDRALNHPGPFLLDVVLEGDVQPEMVGVRCGQ